MRVCKINNRFIVNRNGKPQCKTNTVVGSSNFLPTYLMNRLIFKFIGNRPTIKTISLYITIFIR